MSSEPAITAEHRALARTIAGLVADQLEPLFRSLETRNGEELLTPGRAAKILNVETGTLASWRSKGGGPPYQKFGEGSRAAVRYRRDTLLEWAAKRQFHHTGCPIEEGGGEAPPAGGDDG